MVYLANYLAARNERLMTNKPAKPRQLVKGKRRRHIVDEVIDVLKDWRATPFENEAVVRHGLRVALCLEGHKWALSDIEADIIVQEGLNTIGAERPSWDEGQPSYLIPAENCNWCGIDLPIELLEGPRQGKFCSSICAKAAIMYRDYDGCYHWNRAGRAAYNVIAREKLPHRICKECGCSYQPFNPNGAAPYKDQKYCSQRCRDLAYRMYPARPCDKCGETFKPRNASARYCSKACAVNQGIERTCTHCGDVFAAKTKLSMYCSHRCNLASFRQKRREALAPAAPVITLIPAYQLTAEVFDGWFRRAA